MFAQLILSHCVNSRNKLLTHFVTMLVTVTYLLQVVPTRLIQAVRNKFVLTTCCVQTILKLVEQLVARLLASSALFKDDNNLFQT